MKISTRGRYALRVMVFLADSFEDGYISLSEISQKQNISKKYIESIMSGLSKHHLVDTKNGKAGGYKLNRNPKDYKVREILEITEGNLSPVSCLSCSKNSCERYTYCKTLPMWEGLQKTIKDYFDNITLFDLCQNSERFIDGSGI